jgi:hypothetical protein
MARVARAREISSRKAFSVLLLATEREPGLLAESVQGELDDQRGIDDKHVVSALRASDGRRLLHRASARP